VETPRRVVTEVTEERKRGAEGGEGREGRRGRVWGWGGVDSKQSLEI
jgi:hypothetical protein